VKQKVADKIRLARLAKNLSQQNMADELNITVAAYSNIERGITDISVTRLYQIAGILDLLIEDLLHSEISIAEEVNHNANYSVNNYSQQLYMLIQEVQSLKTKTDQLEKELTRLKSK
jgi:transcriptional regulator with XRE-family HTH domain